MQPNQQVPIVRQAADIQPDGQYQYNYETGNGIAASESGVGGQVAQGSAQWTSPEGIPVAFQYVADANGYQPSGDILPTPPPVPAQILKALEWIRTHPQQEQQQVRVAPQQFFQPQPQLRVAAVQQPFVRRF